MNYPGDYEFAVVGVHPARWKALQEGTIDAAVQLIPLNFVAEDAGYNNLGEVTDYIPEIVFTGLIVDRVAAENRRKHIVAFLQGVIEGTRWVYDPANDEALLVLTKELTKPRENTAGKLWTTCARSGSFHRIFPFPMQPSRNRSNLCRRLGWPMSTWRRAREDVLDDSFRIAALKPD